jgi:hypothetical protein
VRQFVRACVFAKHPLIEPAKRRLKIDVHNFIDWHKLTDWLIGLFECVYMPSIDRDPGDSSIYSSYQGVCVGPQAGMLVMTAAASTHQDQSVWLAGWMDG